MQLEELNHLSATDFVATLGGIFEHSAWVAEVVEYQRPFKSVDTLHQAMVQAIDSAGESAQIKLIQAHPELGGKLAVRGELTAESTQEQAGAGLNQCTPEEFQELTELNNRYQQKFGFPFILAVRGHNRQSIIEAFRQRINYDKETEQHESLQQIYRIGYFRLHDLIQSA